MKVVASIFLVCSVIFAWQLGGSIIADNEYSRQVGSYWSLAEKASSLDMKADLMDKFANSLANQRLDGTNDALFLRTPDNSFDANFSALKSLQARLHEIQGMNVRSFEYQQAISQITAQEQGEAKQMLDVFEGCWYLQHHFMLWGWIGGVLGIGALIGMIVSALAFLVVATD